jgi:prevent-host-death family protein
MTGHNMKSISATEAKARFAALLSDVERGETVEITRHGKTIARIVQPENDDRERARIAVEQIRELKRTGRKTGITVEDILSARDEGRK